MKTFPFLLAAMPILSAFASPASTLDPTPARLERRKSERCDWAPCKYEKRADTAKAHFLAGNVFEFTSTYEALATKGGHGMLGSGSGADFARFFFAVNTLENVVCWNNTFYFYSGEPSFVSIYLGEGDLGSGVSRIIFDNPEHLVDDMGTLRSAGCKFGPFRKLLTGKDGKYFDLRELEQHPEKF